MMIDIIINTYINKYIYMFIYEKDVLIKSKNSKLLFYVSNIIFLLVLRNYKSIETIVF